MVKDLTYDAIKLLRGMVAIPSPSFEEGAVCDYVSGFLTEVGIEHRRIGNNLMALARDFEPGRKTLMLNAHIDTVPPAEGYTLDPYKPDYKEVEKLFGQKEEEIVYGLGANDDGASVVSLIAAFRYFYDKPLKMNLMLVLSCEEERSGPGGMTMLWKLAEDCKSSATTSELGLPKPDFAIIGEPTGMRVATSERGLLVIDGEATGVAGHAAREEGVNALYIALDDIAALRAYRFEKTSPIMGKVKLSVTQINAGTAHNVIPDKCTFVVDIRPTEQYDNQEILTELQKICRSALMARNLKNKSSATYVGSPLSDCIRGLGIETFSSPTTSDWMRIRCDAVKIGPGDSARSHKKDEFVLRSEIESAVATYIKIVEKLTASE